MKISKVSVHNFRSIQSCDFDLKSNITAIAGGNESGKSNALRSIHSFLNKLPFDHEDKYQLSDLDPLLIITFDSFSTAETEQLCEILDVNEVSRLIIEKNKDGYEIIEPPIIDRTISHDPLTIGSIQNVTIEPPDPDPAALAPSATPSPSPSQEPAMSKKEITDLVLLTLPKCIMISTLEDLITGRNIPLAELYMEDLNLLSGKHKIVRSLLDLGAIQKEDLIDADTSRRALTLKRKAAVIADKLRKAWSQEDIKIALDVDQTNLSILFRDGKNRPNGTELENDTKWVWTLPENRSAGFRWFVTFYSMYLNQLSKSSNTVFLIDDAGAGLNKRAQDDLLSEFERITKDATDHTVNQVVYVSHSKYMFRWDMRNQILVADKQPSIGTKIEDFWWTKYAQNDLPPPLDELGVNWLDDLLKNDNLIVEGHSDGTVLLKLLSIFSEEQIPIDPLKGYKIVPGNGVPGQFEIAHLCNFHKRNYLMLFDSDKAGLDGRASAVSKKFNSVDLMTLVGGTEKVVTIEDLLPAQAFIESTNLQGRIYFGDDWEEISRLSKTDEVGILHSLEERLKKNLEPSLVDDFIHKKYFIVIDVLKNISLASFSPSEKSQVIQFFSNIRLKL